MNKESIQAAEALYQQILATDYSQEPRGSFSDCGEEMQTLHISMYGYWRLRYLVDHRAHRAYEFADEACRLLTVTREDIDWEDLKWLPEKALQRARDLNAAFSAYIYSFEQGVAYVSWQLNPDGQYYADSDGYGMTDDEEVNVYGCIDRQGRVVVKFRASNHEQERMRREAQEVMARRGGVV
jgi:hypothetical protein